MKKYFLIFTNTLFEFAAYRVSFLFWRLRVILTMLMTYFLWTSVYVNSTELFNYPKEKMLTYALLMVFIHGFVLSTRIFTIGEEINMGLLSRYLVRPINYFAYHVAKDAADKLIGLCFSVFELGLLVILLQPAIYIQTGMFWLFLFFISIVMATLLYMEIMTVISLLTFWIHDTWSLRFLSMILISFLAGTYFPLDILPKRIYELLIYSPFTYMVFFPLKVYLGDISPPFFLKGITISLGYLLFFLMLILLLWRKGLKVYRAEGQ